MIIYQSRRWEEYKTRRDQQREQFREYQVNLRGRYFNGTITMETYCNLKRLNHNIDGVLHRRLTEWLYSNTCDTCGQPIDGSDHAVTIPATTNEPESVECFPDHLPF